MSIRIKENLLRSSRKHLSDCLVHMTRMREIIRDLSLSDDTTFIEKSLSLIKTSVSGWSKIGAGLVQSFTPVVDRAVGWCVLRIDEDMISFIGPFTDKDAASRYVIEMRSKGIVVCITWICEETFRVVDPDRAVEVCADVLDGVYVIQMDYTTPSMIVPHMVILIGPFEDRDEAMGYRRCLEALGGYSPALVSLTQIPLSDLSVIIPA